MKMRREVVERHFAETIETLYEPSKRDAMSTEGKRAHDRIAADLATVTARLMMGGLMTGAGLSAAPARAQSSDTYEIGYTADLTGAAASTYAPWAEGVRVYVELG